MKKLFIIVSWILIISNLCLFTQFFDRTIYPVFIYLILNTLWGFNSSFQINSSSFDFCTVWMGRKIIWSLPAASASWHVEYKSADFLPTRHMTLHRCCRRLTSVWSDAVCHCHVYLICTDSKRMFGWIKNNAYFLYADFEFCLNILVYFPYLCKCLTGDADGDQEGTENASEWKLENVFKCHL